jgi:SAM-dependent methyltransferase
MPPYSVVDDRRGFRRLDPVPRSDELSRFYESEYYDLIRQGGRAQELGRMLQGGTEAEEELNWLASTLYVDCLDIINEATAGPEHVLDIGSGVGYFVEFLAANGLETEGIEPSIEAVEVAKQRGVHIHHATLEEWSRTEESQGRYRAATLLNVLEHVPEPIEFLRLTRSLVKPGGIVVFRVPNDFSELQQIAQSVTSRKKWWVAVPDHINYFAPGSMGSVCEAAQLEVVDITADFPMEMFLLFGINYVDVPEQGKQAHRMRRNFELNIPKEFRRKFYRTLSSAGIGRDMLVVARRR